MQRGAKGLLNTQRRDPGPWIFWALPKGTADRVCVAAAGLLAVGLHVQPTLLFAGSLVRFSLSDIIALLLAPFAAWLMFQNRRLLKRIDVRVACGLLALATLVMSYGLVIGAQSNGGVTSWALVKYAGWFVLLYYASLGILLSLSGGGRVITVFAGVFVAIHAALTGIFVVSASLGVGWMGEASPRFSGLMTNPNAYGLSLLCGIALLLVRSESFAARWPKYSTELLCGVLVAGVLFTRSVGAVAGLIVAAGIFLIFSGKLVRLLRVLMVAAVVYGLPLAGSSLVKWAGVEQQFDIFGRGIADKVVNPDDYAFSWSARLASNGRALDKWQEAPWFGSGLGSFLVAETTRAREGVAPLQIHNTLLWLLAELGLVGLMAFAPMALALLGFLFRSWQELRERDPPAAQLAIGGVTLLSTWATMSLAHELLYQRVPWFMLGLCLGAALVARSLNCRERSGH